MRRSLALTGTVARSSRRPRLTFAMAVVGVCLLSACGTAGTSADGALSVPADTSGGRSAAASASSASSAGMLSEVARSCPPSAPPEAPPTGPTEALPPDGVETPPSDAIEPIAPTAGPEVELNARDWCASFLHEERVTRALLGLTAPTPTEVRAVLNGLGYVDERIHGLEQSGAATRFFLDLREQGGRLCLAGSAAGERTLVDTCVAPATGPFSPGERER
ncbi:hypothetical protein [Streptomyces sp. NPDC003522]